MDVWKQVCYLGMIGLLAVSVGDLFAQSGDAANGKAVFDTNCLICHEAESDATKVGPGLQGWANQPPHEFNGSEHAHTEETLRQQIQDGSASMPPMGSLISEEEMNDLVAYVMGL